MSVMDKFAKMMLMNEDDAENDYADNDDYLDSQYDEQEIYDDVQERRSEGQRTSRRSSNNKVTSLKSKRTSGSSSSLNPNARVRVIRPSSMEEARTVTEALLDGWGVILNLEGLQDDIAQRITDFSSGSCYAISGNLQRISNYIFIITPPEVELSGDFQDLFGSNNSEVSTIQ